MHPITSALLCTLISVYCPALLWRVVSLLSFLLSKGFFAAIYLAQSITAAQNATEAEQ